ncbi:MAG: PilZ domain-containing protein [Deltaproteobacteria bacterium]|nr:PilZ domain-containing protein [Deltaproteobacteria bacterium]
MADNRRTSARHVVSIAGTLTIAGAPEACEIVNLSLGGALLSATQRHAMGQRVHIAFTVPAKQHLIEVDATVRWADTTSVGIQFDGLRASDVWALNEYFKLLG